MTKPLAFVLMPFDDEFDAVYESLIKDPLDAVGFEVRRADSLLNQQSILRDIVRGIVEATIIVADVSGLNSNVLYELGLAHALGKRVVMITKSIDELPFDLRVYKANEYSTHFRSAQKLRDLLSAIGEATLQDTAEFSNPVQDFAPEMFSASQTANVRDAISANQGHSRNPSAPDDQVTGEEEHGDSDEYDSEPGTLERRVALERLGGELVEHATAIASYTEDIGKTFNESTEKLNLVTTRLGDRSAGAQLAVSRETAKAIYSYVEKTKPESLLLRNTLTNLIQNTDALSRETVIVSNEDAEVVLETLNSLVEFEDSLDQANSGIREFADILLAVPHVDSELTKASKRAGRMLSATGDTLLTALAEVARTRGFLEERVAAYVRSTPPAPS